MSQRYKGFTLIELIVVIGIIAILAAIVIIAVNPGRQFSLARNTQRSSDVLAILNAMHQEIAEDGITNAALLDVFATTTAAYRNVCFRADQTAPQGTNCAGGLPSSTWPATTMSMNANYLVSNYLSALPKDPSGGLVGDDTGYDIGVTKSVATSAASITLIEISAPAATADAVPKTIKVTR